MAVNETLIVQAENLFVNTFDDPRRVKLIVFNEIERKKRLRASASEFRNLTPEGKNFFMRSIFQTIAKEGPKEWTFKCIAGLETMRHNVNEKTPVDPLMVLSEYEEAIKTQTKNNDIYYGSIYRLLEAGKILVPILAKNPVPLAQIMSSWQDIAKQFENEEDRYFLQAQIDYIEESALDNKSRSGMPMNPENIFLRRKVWDLRMRGLNNVQIAEELGELETVINNIARELVIKNKVPRLHDGHHVKKKN